MKALRWLLLIVPLAVVLYTLPVERVLQSESAPVVIGSKKFTESVLLGEMLTQLARAEGLHARHESELGGTQILWRAVRSGDIDAYPEYTGTLLQEMFSQRGLETDDELRAALAEYGLKMSPRLGFVNNYALGMNKSRAAELGVDKISDLRAHPDLVFRFNSEFLERGDGWPSLKRHYALPQTDVRGIDHDVAYRQLAANEIDAMELYTTDAEIAYYDLAVIEDDLAHWPEYGAVIVYRADLEQRNPEAIDALLRLTGKLDETRMTALNKAAKIDRISESRVAAGFLERELGVTVEVQEQTPSGRLIKYTREHLKLVIFSLLAAILVGVPLGFVAAKTGAFGQGILAVVGIIQTIPSLALLVLLIQPLSELSNTEIPVLRELVRSLGVSGLGEWPAMIALFLYSLLPIVRNTATGLTAIAPGLQESAQALGLARGARWLRIELPLASGTILAGIKTAAVINVGFATLGALIGAGGYGDPILTGIRLDNYREILLGAVPAAGLAVLVQIYFELSERVVVPLGLRLKPTSE